VGVGVNWSLDQMAQKPWRRDMKKALVAHGSQILRGAIQHALEVLHFETKGAADENAMLAWLGTFQPELLVIDEGLPQFGAMRAIVSARSFDNGGKKIIAIQKGLDFAPIRSLREAGAHEIIMGGYDSTKLETKLRVLGLLNV
jgi:DNA-binding response OmpR family regulator